MWKKKDWVREKREDRGDRLRDVGRRGEALKGR